MKIEMFQKIKITKKLNLSLKKQQLVQLKSSYHPILLKKWRSLTWRVPSCNIVCGFGVIIEKVLGEFILGHPVYKPVSQLVCSRILPVAIISLYLFWSMIYFYQTTKTTLFSVFVVLDNWINWVLLALRDNVPNLENILSLILCNIKYSFYYTSFNHKAVFTSTFTNTATSVNLS